MGIERGNCPDVHACQKVVRQIRNNSVLTADRAYDIPWFRKQLAARGILDNIRTRAYYHPKIQGLVPGKPAPNPLIYAGRWIVERTLAWMNQFKRLIIRYERCDYLYQSFWSLASAILILKRITG